MNRHYVYDEETNEMNEQQQIDSDFDDASRFGEGVGFVIALAVLLVFLLWCAVWPLQANAQTVLPTCTLTATGNVGAAPLSPAVTWSCTNATACTASGAGTRAQWTGSIPTSGTRTLVDVNSDLTLGLSCTNGTTASKLVEWTHDLKDTKGAAVTPTSWIIDHGTTATLGESKSVTSAEAIQNTTTKVYSNTLTGLPPGARQVAIRAVFQPTGTPTPPALVSERSGITVHNLVVPSAFRSVLVDVIDAPTPPVNVTVVEVVAYRDQGNGVGTRVAMTPLRSTCAGDECTVVARVEQ
jgi:hypothetical protein